MGLCTSSSFGDFATIKQLHSHRKKMSGSKRSQFQIEAFRIEAAGLDYDENWKILEQAIRDVYECEISRLDFAELYRRAYLMVLHGYGEKFYSGVVSAIRYHVQMMSKSIDDAQGTSFLDELSMKWLNHNRAMNKIRDLLMYMDRTFIPSTHKTQLHEVGSNLWIDHVIHLENIKPRLVNALLELILKERKGETVNKEQIERAIKMLRDLGPSVYEEDFEKPFLEASTSFYRAESAELIRLGDRGDYTKHIEKRLHEEKERVQNYLDQMTEPKLVSIVETEMMVDRMGC